MKAAVLNAFGEAPHCLDFAEPNPEPHETIVTVDAASIKQRDRKWDAL